MHKKTKPAALVTGGAQGIGRAVAERFLSEGLNVLVADKDSEACEEIQEEKGKKENLRAEVCDAADENGVKKAVSETINRFERLDVLVCNAGISGFFGVPVTELTLEQWQRVISVNLTGCFLFAKHAVPHLEKARGCIINIGSTRAVQSEPHTEAYSASKGGIVALTHALAVSLGPQIRVNCISPGWIETGPWQKKARRTEPGLTQQDHAQHPSGRVGIPEDVASMASWLASEDAGFVTGQNFIIDGGMTRKMIYA
ncbi:MAG: glucose 1-dehydrogenase [Desulfobacterales bacterium]